MTVPLMSAFYGDSYWTGTDLIMSPFGVLVEWVLPALAVIVFWIAFDKRKQGWHDKLAATVAVRPKAGGPEPVKLKNA
jgi:uncharacterized RDD family membrane protein YckC